MFVIRYLSLLCLLAICLSLSSHNTEAESGGPDSFGYTFKDSDEVDGPTNNWIDVSSNGTAINISDNDGPHDSVAGPYELGFNFFFYGEWYSQWWLHGDNGAITFSQPEGVSWTPHNFSDDWQDSEPNHDIDMIGAFKTDLSSQNCTNATLSYKTIGNAPSRALVIEYENFNTYYYGIGGCTREEYGTYNFQIILFEESGDILFQYDNDYSNGTDYLDEDNLYEVGIGIQGSANAGIGYYYDVISDNITNQAVRFYAPPIPVLDLAISDLRYDIPISYNFNETISATIMNRGSVNQTNFNVSFKISNSDDVVLINYTRNIEFIERYGSRIIVEYVTPALVDQDFEINDNITITVSLVISDENMSNNEIRGEAKILYIFFRETFEEGTWENSGWDFSESQAWNYTTDANGNRSMFSGYRCSQDRPALTSITSPSIDLSVGSNISLKFSHSYYFFDTYEGAFLEIDVGNGFTKINPEGDYVNPINNAAHYGNPIRGSWAWTEYSNYGGYESGWVYGTSPSEVVFDLSSFIDTNSNNDYSNVKLRWSVGLSNLECSFTGRYGFDNIIITGDVNPHDVEITNFVLENSLPLSKSLENEVDTLINLPNGTFAATLKNNGFKELNLNEVTFRLEIWELDKEGVYSFERENFTTTTGILYPGEKINILINYDSGAGEQYLFIIFADYELDMNEEDNERSLIGHIANLAYHSNDYDWADWTIMCNEDLCQEDEIASGTTWQLTNNTWNSGNDTIRNTYDGDDNSILSPTFNLKSARNTYIVLEHTYQFAWDDGGRIEVCYNSFCTAVSELDGITYDGVINDYEYYGNPLGGADGFQGSNSGITIVKMDEEFIPEAYLNEVSFKIRMGGTFYQSSGFWTIHSFRIYSSGEGLSSNSIEMPDNVLLNDEVTVNVNYTNTGTENIDFLYVQASISNNNVNSNLNLNLISYQPITNLESGDSIIITFNFNFSQIISDPYIAYVWPPGNFWINEYEIEVKIVDRSPYYSNTSVDLCAPTEFAIGPNKNYIYLAEMDEMSFYCSNKFIPSGDIYPHILRKNFNVTSIKPVISLSDESKVLLEEANYTFIEPNIYDISYLEDYDVIILIGNDEDGVIDYFEMTSSLWQTQATFECWKYCLWSDMLPNLPTGSQTITIHAIDDYGVRSDPLVFNLTIFPDYDFDGVPDYLDDFWTDATEWLDTDKDGYGDNQDLFPNNSDEWYDTDGDGMGDNADDCDSIFISGVPNGFVDTDGDGYCEKLDMCPEDPEDWLDLDSDGICDNADKFPLDEKEWLDTDKDGYGDNGDLFPKNPNEWYDTDGDGIGDNSDLLPENRFFHAHWHFLVFAMITGFAGISVKHGYHLFTLSTKVDRKIDEVKKIIFELNEKGVKTKNLDEIVEEVEEGMKKWILK